MLISIYHAFKRKIIILDSNDTEACLRLADSSDSTN